MDCFCGSGTTLFSANNLGRHWIGIDQSNQAISATKNKLNGIEEDLFTNKAKFILVELNQQYKTNISLIMQQLSLFDNEFCDDITIKEAASQLSVSEASILNWRKEGLLVSNTPKTVSQQSVNTFLSNYAGITKLTARANKLQKTEKIISSFTIDTKINGNELADKYQSSLTDAYRNKEGIFYTPTNVVEDMLQSIDTTDIANTTFLEPACGCGNFIIEAIKKGIRPENIFAFDTDVNAVEITKKRIFELTGYSSKNIHCADFLEIWSTINQQFDYIFTNPPWGKKISKDLKSKYSVKYHTGNSTDTSAIFLMASTKLLKANGILGFLLPDAFFNISTFEDARLHCLSYEICRMIDYGKAFKGLITKAQALILKNNSTKSNKISCEKDFLTIAIREQYDFENTPKHIFNFDITNSESEVIKHVLKQPHTTLKDNAAWALGIVTGDNNKVLSRHHANGLVPIFRGKDISPTSLANPQYFIDETLSNCRQVAPIQYYKAPQKIIYRFISDHLICYVDNNQNYILNSANLLITNSNFPISMENLASLLNSRIINWLFKKIFNTHKILRGDLEELPIFTDFFKHNRSFEETELLEYLKIEENNGTYNIKK